VEKVVIVILALSALVRGQTHNNQKITSENLSRSHVPFHDASGEGKSEVVFEGESAVPSSAFASIRSGDHPVFLTGVLSHDLFTSDSSARSKDSMIMHETRSALMSVFFSSFIPGVGQAYNGEYIEVVEFLELEAAG